jgi:hypothetical protein
MNENFAVPYDSGYSDWLFNIPGGCGVVTMLHVFLDWDIFYDHQHLHSEPFLTGIIYRMKLFKFNNK